MRTITTYTLALLLFIASSGCRKNGDPKPDCEVLQAQATIIRIAGPDSIRAGIPQSLTLELIAPDLCVSDITVSVKQINDTTYHMNPVVSYNTGPDAGCSCSVAPRHYVRVFFSPPVAGWVSISTGSDTSFGPGYQLRVY